MNIDDVRKRITAKTKAIIPVHYAGNLCDMDALLEIGEGYHLRIVEDVAHALGSYYEGKRLAVLGGVTCFSFDLIKNMTPGERGAIVCQDAELVELLR